MSDWWKRDARYGQPGWTVIHDENGTRFVFAEPRPRRRPARALRFPDLRVGDVLLHRGKSTWTRRVRQDRPEGAPVSANDDEREVSTTRRHVGLALCTDRWQDPVAGHDDPVRGDMVGFRRVTNRGVEGPKQAHPIRGMATNGYHPTTPDQAERVRVFLREREELVDAWNRGLVTPEEARLRSTPWRSLLRDLGLDEAGDPV